jgi:F-box protein 21
MLNRSPLLPLDILLRVLESIPPTPESAATLLSASQCSASLWKANASSVIWKSHYIVRYSHCNAAKEQARIANHEGNWRLMYAERRRVDSKALELLDMMISDRDHRFEHAKKLFTLSLDVYDVLALQTQVEGGLGDESPTRFSRAYWAREMMNSMSRMLAMRNWYNVLQNHGNVTYRIAYNSFSAFLGGDCQKVRFPFLRSLLLFTFLILFVTYRADGRPNSLFDFTVSKRNGSRRSRLENWAQLRRWYSLS